MHYIKELIKNWQTQNTTLSEQSQNDKHKILHCWNSPKMTNTKYYTVGTVPKWQTQNTTLLEQSQNSIKKSEVKSIYLNTQINDHSLSWLGTGT